MTSSIRAQKEAVVSIYLMGQFKLTINNNDCTHLLTYDKVKLLLAILALSQGRRIARARLADMLWPDSQDDQGRARVRHALHTLRQAFAAAPQGLVNDTTGLSLNPDVVWIDVLSIVENPRHASLDTIKAKLEYYTGPFLEGIKLPPSEGLLTWQQSWNARLDLELTQCRSRLIDQYLDQDNTQAALNHAKLWVHRWPEDEACHRLLIRLLLLSGDRDAALSAFHHCCDVMNKRLGVVPSTETRALLGLENHALSTQSLVSRTHVREASYRPIAIVAIALAWTHHAERTENDHNDDPSEDALETIHAWHERLLTRAQQHGAWLPQTGSTTILAHFGYPSLSESPIMPAIHLAKDLASLNTPANVSVGLAIHADLVLIDQALELSLNGLLCQIAVPLAWGAEHGEILLSPAAVARMADWPIETVQRGGCQYVRLASDSGSTPVARMHGRMREFDTLIQQWTRHRRGHSPITVQVTGASGLGKSQLAQAMADYVRNVDGLVITLQSRENHHEIPLHAIHPWLRTQLDLPDSLNASLWTPTQYDQAVLDMQTRFKLPPEACHALLDAVLNRGDTLGDAYKTAINTALIALPLHAEPTRPVLIVWDDIHWNDTTSTSLLQRIMASEGSTTTMLLCTSRTTVIDAPSAINIELGPLDTTTIAEYVVHKTRKTKLSRDVKADLVSDSSGIPLYIKELLHLKLLGLPCSTIPRLTDMLAAQLLQLDSDTRNIAYLLALLHTLDHETAMKVLGLNQGKVESGLNTLARLGIAQHGGATHVTCTSMVSRSIRRLMMRRKKHTFCEKIAHHLISEHPSTALVAIPSHGAHSPETDVWWQHVVDDAMQKGSPNEAAEYITHALISGQYIHDPLHGGRFKSECNATLGACTPDAEHAAPSLIQTPENAAQSDPPDDPATTLTVLWRQWVAQHNLGNLTASLHIARRLQQMAVNQRHDVWHGWALYALAQHDLWMGNPVASESLLLQSLTTIHQGTGQEHPIDAFGNHSYALAYAALGWAQALQGRYNAALQNSHHAIQLASKSASPTSATACKLHLLRIHYLANNLKALQAESTTLPEHLSASLPNNAWAALITAHTLLPRASTQPTEKTIQTLQMGLDVVQSNMPVATESYLCMLARCQIAMGSPNASAELLNQAAAIARTRQSSLLSSEIHCIRGDAWVALQRPELARQEWLKAKTVARQCSLLAYDEWANERLESLVG